MSLSLFFAIYCLEAGLFFLIVPWTMIWSVNPVLHSTPVVGMVADNPFMRGFISGIGLLHLIIGVRDILRAWDGRRRNG